MIWQHLQGGIMLPSDIYSQPNAADPVLDERTVLDLVRRHGVRCSAITSIDETGGEARVYVLDDNLVLKIQRPHRLRPRTSLAKEVFFLQQLAAYPDIVVPQVLGYGRQGNIEYTVMTQMPGVPALMVELTGEQRLAVLHQLGRTLRRLHSLPQAPFYGSALFPGTRTQEAFVARVRATLAQAVQVIGATPHLWQLSVPPAELAARVLAAFPASVDLVALHSNPGPVHTFVRPDSHDFVGLIDFGDAYISHPALDWRWPTHDDRVALLHGYCDDTPATEEFMATWRAAFVLSDMSALAIRPEARPQALGRLRDLLMTFG
jgi:aminoglycoside phosphotransferase (APT) family kinase protein